MRAPLFGLATSLCFLTGGCVTRSEERLLAVGGVHVLEGPAPCRLLRASPTSALEDLHWKDTLALRARGEGAAEVASGSSTLRLRLVEPARLTIVLVDEKIVTNERFHVRARLYDGRGRELEVGKFTEIAWSCSSGLEIHNDLSAGEFGLCDTCFGTHGFRATRPGEGLIEARLGQVKGTLPVNVPRPSSGSK